MIQETLEEAAENYAIDKQNENASKYYMALESFQEGAKWQAERMYSEEEVQIMLYECLGHFAQKHNIIIKGNEIEQWFEQFKKEVI